MRIIADLHIHSKYSRATSKDMDIEHIAEWSNTKGINIVGTGDFTHPLWFSEIKEKLEDRGDGLFTLKSNSEKKVNPVYFMLTTELSCIYTENNRTRKIHLVVFAPNLTVVEKINTQLSWIGNIKSDGRPILGMDAKDLAKLILETSKECMVIPAHIWTPWFSIFGSQSGFDSIEECFGELSSQIYSIETGLSSDPPMNWRLSSLDKITLISNSDAHSPANLGREANVFELERPSYQEICRIIRTKDTKKFLYTIEFFPEEGKYHFDGHRNCDIMLSPEETEKYNGICPKCKKPLTIGVMNRVIKLADRKKDSIPNNTIGYKSLVPLDQIIANALGQNRGTKAVEQEYQNLIKLGKNEFHILLNISLEELKKMTSPRIVEGIKRVREKNIKIIPGYDGEYGKVEVFNESEQKDSIGQKSLF